MVNWREDQAAGLRRLFAGQRASVLAVISGRGHGAALAAAQALAARGEDVLLIDERRGADSAAARCGVGTRYDLAQVLAGDVALEQACVPAGAHLHLMCAARARHDAAACTGALWSRLLRAWRWIVIDCADGESALAAGAERIALIAGTSAVAITAGYAQLKQAAARAPRASWETAVVGGDRETAAQAYDNLRGVCRHHLGRDLMLAGIAADGYGAGRLLAARPPAPLGAGTQVFHDSSIPGDGRQRRAVAQTC